MAKIVSTDELFSFVGAQTDQKTTQATMVGELIDSMQRELQKKLNRSIESVSLTAFALREGRDFEFQNDYTVISLIGHYRDLYTLTSLTEAGTALTQSTTYNDGKDYIVDFTTGCIEKISGSWNTDNFAIAITGKYGYVNSDHTPRDDIRQIVMEMVASKSGLWKKTFISPDGTLMTDKDKLERDFNDLITGHMNLRL
jgi:hypothetical protein